MTHLQNKIFMKKRDHFPSERLAKCLQTNGLIVVDSTEAQHIQTVPQIIFQSELMDLNNEYPSQSIDNELQSTFPQVIFIIQDTEDQSTKQPYLHAETVVYIQLPTPFQSTNSTDTLIDQVGDLIAKYMDNPPEAGTYTEQISREKTQAQTVGVVGLGYVGLPIAVAFAKEYNVIGIDINEQKTTSLATHNDPAGEICSDTLKKASIHFTTDFQAIERCDYVIVAVPTPITPSNKPDLSYLIEATTMISKHLAPETVVIYESTVYPGTTEEVCIPQLEAHSSLVAGKDFYVGYSPERMNPGDLDHTFTQNNKVVSGQNEVALAKIVQLYESVLHATIHQAPTIAVAETSKIVENAQRDINIAFMNEIAMICHTLDLDTNEVLRAAETKWNFLPFSPGLVGGHCIGVDPYYLMYKSARAGYDPTFLSAARKLNDSITQYIVQQLLQLLVKRKYSMKKLQITVLGITFKENISDLRNSKALEIIGQLKELQIDVQLCDPHVCEQELRAYTQFPLKPFDELKKADVVIIPVPHDEFRMPHESFFNQLFTNNQGIVMDIKGLIPPAEVPPSITYWTL